MDLLLRKGIFAQNFTCDFRKLENNHNPSNSPTDSVLKMLPSRMNAQKVHLTYSTDKPGFGQAWHRQRQQEIGSISSICAHRQTQSPVFSNLIATSSPGFSTLVPYLSASSFASVISLKLFILFWSSFFSGCLWSHCPHPVASAVVPSAPAPPVRVTAESWFSYSATCSRYSCPFLQSHCLQLSCYLCQWIRLQLMTKP